MNWALSPMLSAALSRKYLRLPLLLAVATLVWLFATDRWNPAAWQVPTAYAQDALEVLARLKISGEQGVGFLVDKTMPRLGAPWGADWSAYPMPDVPVFLLFGKLAGVIGLIPASNLALLFAHLSAVAAFYVSSRALGHRDIFAAGTALLFGFSFYLFHRGLSHYSFALAYLVPAQLLSAWLIGGSQRMLARRPWQIFCLATAGATAVGSPYFGFAYCQLLLLALAYQATTTRRRRNLMLGLVCLGVFVVTLCLLNYSALLAMLPGNPGLLQRNYASTEIYGLRPIELFIPHPFHPWPWAAGIAAQYAASTSLRGELFSPYLGLAGICGLLVIAAGACRRLFRVRAGFRPAYAATFVWFICFFMVGGLNSLLAFAGVDLFRAGNRFSIYLLALALFALASYATRRGRRLTVWAALAMMVPAVLVGLWDQIPKRRSRAESSVYGEKIAVDQLVANTLEMALAPGAAVFQLPVVPFLEQPPVHHMTDYELFRPWFFSRSVGFSYGLLANDRALRWQRWIATRPAGPLCAALEKAGYAALYIHKAAFPDSGTALRRELTALGKQLLVEAGDHLVFSLHPDGHPAWPDLGDPRLVDPWNRVVEPDNQPQIFATEGWSSLEQEGKGVWRWAGQNATVTVWCPGEKPMEVRLEYGASALRPARLTATFEGRKIWQAMAGQMPPAQVSLALLLQPGPNFIIFHYNGRPAQPSLTDPRILGFRLDNLRVIPAAGR